MGSGAASKSMGTRLAAVVAAAVFVCPAQASPWARVDGELLIISQTKYFYSDLTSQDPRGARFESVDSDTHIEFGLTDDVTIGAKAIYGTSWLTNTRGTETDSGFSEIEGYLQYQFARDDRQAASVKFSAARPPRARAAWRGSSA